MEFEDIQKELARRFALPLPEYARRHVVFWQDPEGEFAEEIGGLELPGVQVLQLTGHNQFLAKKLLTHDDLEHDFLVYVPFAYERESDDWLLDVELCSEPSFRADLLSIWMHEMEVPELEAYRQLMRRYRKFFQAKERRQHFCTLLAGQYTQSQFVLGMMTVATGASSREPEAIFRRVFADGYDMAENTSYGKLQSYGLDAMFWSMAQQMTGYDEGEQHDLWRLLLRIFRLATRRMLPSVAFEEDADEGTVQQQTRCYDFVLDWQQESRAEVFYPIVHDVEMSLSLPHRLEALPAGELIGVDLFPCVDEVILAKWMQDVLMRQHVDAEALQRMIEARRTGSWYARTAPFYEGLWQVAEMIAFAKAHAAGFHETNAQALWEAYTKDFYRMDEAYRAFHVAFAQALSAQEHDALDDLYKKLADVVENLYAQGFLEKLGANWTKVAAHDLAAYGRISGVLQQESFYATKVKGAQSRIFVIISDAMRYAVGATLAEELEQELPSEVELTSCQAMFPSITKFGMAALLPHRELSLKVGDHGYSVLADGKSTEAGAPRTALLQAANPSSVALRARDIVKSKREDRKAMVRGREVVYIYHDVIDATSHTDDSKVFSACRDAIDELKNLVRIIVNDFGGIHVIVTADHGFLYTYRPLREDSKAALGAAKEQLLDLDRRYAILEKGAEPPAHLLPVKFLHGTTPYMGYAPRDAIRLKLKGAGMNYVHGGISLQEMVVPIVTFQYVRTDSLVYRRNSERFEMRPVELQLLTATRKIGNLTFALSFYQKQPVGSGWRPATYDLCFVDEKDHTISDVQRIIADRTSLDNPQRVYRVTFHLKGGNYEQHHDIYLVIRNAETNEVTLRESMQVDIAFEQGALDFFS